MRQNVAVLVTAGIALLAVSAYSMRAELKQPISSRHKDPTSMHQRLDLVSGRIWRLTGRGVSVQGPGIPRPVEVELPGWIVAGPVAGVCPPDLALGPKGEVVVTSNVVPTLWRIDPETLAPTVHALRLDADDDRDVGFTKLRFSALHGAYFAISSDGSVWKIATSLTRGEKVFAAGISREAMKRSLTCAIN